MRGRDYTADELLQKVGKLKHTPYHPPRAGTPAEGIFLSLWQEMVLARPDVFLGIFRDCLYVGQSTARVAASFMSYMGCNGGGSLTHECESAAKRVGHFSRADAYLGAWAIHNSRRLGINNGLRCAEYMLAREYPIHREGFGHAGYPDWRKVPVSSQDDNDALEAMVVWWSTADAQALRTIADPLLAVANERERSKLFNREAIRA